MSDTTPHNIPTPDSNDDKATQASQALGADTQAGQGQPQQPQQQGSQQPQQQGSQQPQQQAPYSGGSTTPETNARPRNEVLETEHGTTVIDDSVVGKIAGIAAREVSGVHNLGGGAARMFGAIRESLTSSTNVQQGVNVVVDNGHAAVAVAIIAEYGVAIHELANAIRENITIAITRMTGLIVDRVDVTVHDINLPDQNQNQNAERENANGGPVTQGQVPNQIPAGNNYPAQ